MYSGDKYNVEMRVWLFMMKLINC